VLPEASIAADNMMASVRYLDTAVPGRVREVGVVAGLGPVTQGSVVVSGTVSFLEG